MQMRKRAVKQEEKQEQKQDQVKEKIGAAEASIKSDDSEQKEYLCSICNYFTNDKRLMVQNDNNVYNYPE
jgi:hypothetical protein